MTYWNDLGWHDSDSLDAATDRQNWYASLRGSTEVYTPEAVVDGHKPDGGQQSRRGDRRHRQGRRQPQRAMYRCA